MIKAEYKSDPARKDGPIHAAFGLGGCAYHVVPRIALQSMPIWWQRLFVWLVSMLPQTPEYVCQLRDNKGRFGQPDPWANYRHGDIQEIINDEVDKACKKLTPGEFFELPNNWRYEPKPEKVTIPSQPQGEWKVIDFDSDQYK